MRRVCERNASSVSLPEQEMASDAFSTITKNGRAAASDCVRRTVENYRNRDGSMKRERLLIRVRVDKGEESSVEE